MANSNREFKVKKGHLLYDVLQDDKWMPSDGIFVRTATNEAIRFVTETEIFVEDAIEENIHNFTDVMIPTIVILLAITALYYALFWKGWTSLTKECKRKTQKNSKGGTVKGSDPQVSSSSKRLTMNPNPQRSRASAGSPATSSRPSSPPPLTTEDGTRECVERSSTLQIRGGVQLNSIRQNSEPHSEHETPNVVTAEALAILRGNSVTPQLSQETRLAVAMQHGKMRFDAYQHHQNRVHAEFLHAKDGNWYNKLKEKQETNARELKTMTKYTVMTALAILIVAHSYDLYNATNWMDQIWDLVCPEEEQRKSGWFSPYNFGFGCGERVFTIGVPFLVLVFASQWITVLTYLGHAASIVALSYYVMRQPEFVVPVVAMGCLYWVGNRRMKNCADRLLKTCIETDHVTTTNINRHLYELDEMKTYWEGWIMTGATCIIVAAVACYSSTGGTWNSFWYFSS